MVYKKLYVQVIIRVLLILSTCFVLSRIFFTPRYIHASIVVSGLLLLETLELIKYLNRTNTQLAKFFASLLDRGSSFKFDGIKATGSFRELGIQLEEVNKLIQTERREKEAEHNYLTYLIEHIGVGVITFREDGRIDLINPAAKKIFAEENIPDLSYLNKFNPEFEKSIKNLELNKHALLRIIVRSELFYLTVQKSLFKMQDQSVWLITFQDINSELDKKELDSWQKIIRVLTHEIMSSISPVSTLSGHMLKKMHDPEDPGKLKTPDRNGLEDIAEGLEIIKTRGEGLMDFVGHYHSLTHLPVPEMKEVDLATFLEKILNLMKPDFEKKQIAFDLEVRESLLIFIDPKLIQQVMINLLKNAIHAVEDASEKNIRITAGRSTGSGIQISVKDNGCGIDTENMDNIFIPFYTTREKGSGIGLSLAKQIMRLHNGQISVKSEVGKGTEFILRF